MGSYLADTNLLLRLADPNSEQHAVRPDGSFHNVDKATSAQSNPRASAALACCWS